LKARLKASSGLEIFQVVGVEFPMERAPAHAQFLRRIDAAGREPLKGVG